MGGIIFFDIKNQLMNPGVHTLKINGRINSVLQITFASLKHKNFRYFWMGQCISLMGTWMQRTAQVWLVYSVTNSPLLVGLVGVCQFMPMLLFTLITGALVDRFPKRKILLLTQSCFMLQAVILTLLTFSGAIRYWHILILSVLLGLTQTLDMPARQSFFIELVGKNDVMNAISLNSTIVNLAKIVGPAISGVVMVKFGPVICFLVNAMSFLAVITSLLFIKTDDTVPKRVRRYVLQEIKEGLAYIRKSDTLMLNVLFMGIICTFAMNNDVILPVYAKTVLQRGAGAYTNLMTAAGIGSLIAAILMATIAGSGLKKGILVIGAVSTSILQLLMLGTRNFYLALIFVGMIGFLNLAFLNVGNSIFQINSADEYRGRVMSVYSFLTQGSTPIGNFYSGSIMQWAGGSFGYPACGAASLILILPILVIKRKTITAWFGR